ncbi:Serine/threonine-protein kinase, partial [Thalictrum thalictroides]
MEMVAACSKKRPSSKKLLKHHFCKHARQFEYLAKTILDGLPPLGDRFRLMKAKDANFLVQNKANGDKEHLSQSFMEMVAACSKKRPSSKKLLKHHFCKHARQFEYLAKTILDGLPPLGDRFRLMKAKDANFLVQNKANGDKEHLSQ